MLDPAKIDWWDTFVGAVGGAFMAVIGLFGWFGKKIGAVHAEIEELKQEQSECRESRGTQLFMHEENTRRFNSLEEGNRQILKILLERSK